MRRTSVAGALLATALALGGCDLVPGAAGPEARDADESFELMLRVGSGRYAANQPIDVSATLSYLGPDAGSDLVGSGSGLVTFGVDQLDGVINVSGVSTDDCRPYRLDRGRPLVVPYSKSGGWSAEDPDAAFYEAFFADPQFRLPNGRWQIRASADFTLGECGGVRHGLDAQVTIVVE